MAGGFLGGRQLALGLFGEAAAVGRRRRVAALDRGGGAASVGGLLGARPAAALALAGHRRGGVLGGDAAPIAGVVEVELGVLVLADQLRGGDDQDVLAVGGGVAEEGGARVVGGRYQPQLPVAVDVDVHAGGLQGLVVLGGRQELESQVHQRAARLAVVVAAHQPGGGVEEELSAVADVAAQALVAGEDEVLPAAQLGPVEAGLAIQRPVIGPVRGRAGGAGQGVGGVVVEVGLGEGEFGLGVLRPALLRVGAVDLPAEAKAEVAPARAQPRLAHAPFLRVEAADQPDPVPFVPGVEVVLPLARPGGELPAGDEVGVRAVLARAQHLPHAGFAFGRSEVGELPGPRVVAVQVGAFRAGVGGEFAPELRKARSPFALAYSKSTPKGFAPLATSLLCPPSRRYRSRSPSRSPSLCQ